MNKKDRKEMTEVLWKVKRAEKLMVSLGIKKEVRLRSNFPIKGQIDVLLFTLEQLTKMQESGEPKIIW